MVKEPNKTPVDDLSSTNLSLERTALSHERTLMSWIRTATSMITFGFTIYKFFEEMSPANAQRILTPRIVGMTMIGFGFLGLLLAQIQHQAARKKLKAHYPDMPRSISSAMSVLILIFGLMMFLGVLYRQ